MLCEPFCLDVPCGELNGDALYECGACPPAAPSVGCHPAARSFPRAATVGVAVSAAGQPDRPSPRVPDDDGWPIDFGRLEIAGAHWLFHAHAAGVLSVQFLCDGRRGRATELHGARNSSEIGRSAEGGWCIGRERCWR